MKRLQFSFHGDAFSCFTDCVLMFAHILTFKASNCKSLQSWWKPLLLCPNCNVNLWLKLNVFQSSIASQCQTAQKRVELLEVGSWEHLLTLVDPEVERIWSDGHRFIRDTQQTAGSSLSEGYLKINSLKQTRKKCRNNSEITKLNILAPVQLSWTWMLFSKAEWSDMIHL